MMLKLYKFVDGAWRHVDWGVPAKADVYAAQGYVVTYYYMGRRGKNDRS